MNDILEILRDEKYLGQEGMRNLAAEEISLLRADKDKLVEALAQALANCGALRSPALPSEEEIARAICKSRTGEGIACCQWPANLGRTKCPVLDGGYDDAVRRVLALIGDCT